MQFERLVIESGASSVSFDLHPRLTVIAGMSQMERDGLINEFVGALGNSRSGIHLELVAGNGNRFAVFRPSGAPHRVIDVDHRTDVTQQFSDATGSIDLLSRAGLDVRTARKVMRFGSQDLAETTERGAYIQQLARIEQNELWSAAEALVIADRRMEEEADAVGSSVEDAEVIERIERHHEQFERTQVDNEKVRRMTFLAAGFAALLAVPAAALIGTFAVIPLGLVALAAVAVSIVYWQRMEKARTAEEAALADAGAQSYLGFHLQRVNSLLGSDQGRQRLIRAAEEHRQAAQRWHALAGEVDVNWAVANRAEITGAARLRADVLLTHLHWDHMLGLPFLPNADHPGSEVAVWAPRQGDRSTYEHLRTVMSPPAFPIEPGELRGAWSFHEADVTPSQRDWLAPLVERAWPAHDVRFPGLARRLHGGYRSITSRRSSQKFSRVAL